MTITLLTSIPANSCLPMHCGQ